MLWTPLLFFILLALVQIGIYLFAEHVAATAAQAGDRSGRQNEPLYANDPQTWKGMAKAAANNWVDDLIGQGVAKDINADPELSPLVNQCTPQIVTVTVTFTTSSLFGRLSVHGQSEGPVENFYPNNC